MEPNPYTPGEPPRVLVGRERERAILRDRLARVIAYGEMAGPLLIVTGPRGLGKTSLLRDIGAEAASKGFVVAWTAGVKHQPFLSDLIDQVTRAMRRADIPTSTEKTLRLEELSLELNVGLAKVSGKIGTGDHPGQEVAVGLLGPLEEFLRDASNIIRQRGGAGLLVVIDELHAPIESRSEREYDPNPSAVTDAGIFLNVVQNMTANREDFPVAVLGAGLPQTKTLLTRAATFGERVHELVLTELDPESSSRVLTEPSRRHNVEWSEEAIARAVHDADGYPQSLQVIGSAAWEAARPDEGATIDLAHLEASQKAVAAQMSSMFQTRWDIATEAERDFLRAMAALERDTVTRAEIAAELGVNSNSLGMPRRSLLNKGIIEAPEYGHLRFTIPGFGAFVREQ